MKTAWTCSVLLLGSMCLPLQTHAAERVALIIANQDYQQSEAKLSQPLADAELMRQTLSQSKFGFQIYGNRVQRNLSRREFETTIREFANQAQGADVALVYYAGHGAQDGKENYLIPTDAQIGKEWDYRYEAVELQFLLDYLKGAGAAVNLVFLDACRNNPFGGKNRGSKHRGLLRQATPAEILVSYSTSAGNVAADASPYTRALSQAIQALPHHSIYEVITQVNAEVKRHTQDQQIPDFSSSLTQSFCFAGCGDSSPRPKPNEPEMVFIKGGTFMMGSPESEQGREHDERQHKVTLDDFYMGKHEVTVGEFRAFVQATGYKTQAEQDSTKGCFGLKETREKVDLEWLAQHSWRSPGFAQTAQHPVVCVSWEDANAYTAWLTSTTGTHYYLPTEAQWEYAARAGSPATYAWGANPAAACRSANVADTSFAERYSLNENAEFSCDDGAVHTAPVASLQANTYGLYDMLGNVTEWTCSAYDSSYQEGKEQRCTVGHEGQHVTRPGSWYNQPELIRFAYRGRLDSSDRSNFIGFRLAKMP